MLAVALLAAVLGIGVARHPGETAEAPVQYRYQYLTGNWHEWNPDGTFVSRYVDESARQGVTPVLTYYKMLGLTERTGSEPEVDLANLADPAAMRRYYADFRLALRRARSKRRVIVHVEPDLWGYVQHAGDPRRVRAAVRSAGQRGPDTAAGFARALVRIRDRTARNVELAWHLSTWGTKEDPAYSNPPLGHMDVLARRSATFYARLGARFDYVFNDVADRDAGWRRHIAGDGGASEWDAADFARHARYIRGVHRRTRRPVMIWQVPLGNSTLPDSWGRYRDNRVETWLGEDRAPLRALRDAGVVGLLFGAGADGNTTPETDGGVFWRLARAYAGSPLKTR